MGMKAHIFRTVVAAAAVSAALLPSMASAAPITKTVNVSVYQLCDDDGLNCAAKGPAGNDYFAESTNKIWEQAGISVTFSFISQIRSTAFLDLDDIAGDDFAALHAGYGTGGPSNTSVDMFLINTFAGAYGVGWSGQGGLLMSMQTIMDFDCGGELDCTGRIDTLAHELGHNFGLVPDSWPDADGTGHWGEMTGNDDKLMAGGAYRWVPTTVLDIYPSGLGYSKLTADEIALARMSSLLHPVPEPSAYAMMLAGLIGIGVIRRRRPA